MRRLMSFRLRCHRMQRAQLALCLLALVTCDNPTGPQPGDTVAIIFGLTNELSDSSRVAAVAVPEGMRLPEGDHLGRFVESTTLSPDRSVAYGSTYAVGSSLADLFALDLRTLRLRWHERRSDIAARSTVGPITLGDAGMCTSRDGTRLFVGASTTDGFGVAAIDLATRTPVMFGRSLQVVGVEDLVLAPPRAGFPDGILLAAGVEDPNASPSTSMLFLIDPNTLAVIDSIPNLTPPINGRGGSIFHLVVAANGRDVYGDGLGWVVEIDLDTRAVIALTPTTPFALGMAVAPDGSAVFIADGGDFFDTPGSGTIFRYDAGLHPLTPIQLPTNLPPHQEALTTSSVAVSADGHTLYVTSGDADLGPNFGFEPARLLIVDLPTGHVRAVALGDAEPQAVYLRAATAVP